MTRSLPGRLIERHSIRIPGSQAVDRLRDWGAQGGSTIHLDEIAARGS